MQVDFVIEKLKKLPLFSDFPESIIAELFGRMRPIRLAEGETLFRKGDPGISMYFVNSGEAKIILEDAYGRELVLNQVGRGAAIGDMSLVDDETRSAGVVALSPMELLELHEDDFIEVLNERLPGALDSMRDLVIQLRRDKTISDLKKIPIFSDLPDDVIADLAVKLETRHLEENETLFHRGDPASALYVIKTGWVKIVTEDAGGEELVLNQCGPGEAIGEMSLIDEEARSASVIALSPADVLRLERADFMDVLTAHPQLSLGVMRYLSNRLRFNTTYIEQAIELSQRIAEGDYDFAMDQIQASQSSVMGDGLSAEDRAGRLLSAFFTMVKGVKAREEELKEKLQQLTIEIDEAKRRQEFESLTSSSFFSELKATAQKLREERDTEED